ncbi:hypothetical protein IDH44_12790 [Paenibacillus sp. IB182496]|uniref:DUF5067 domain-containing protein n=1 Tax=Paenibacillus sabuli TaxID=2772509 RepID=A0A927GRW4_9BACL|nr:hypothetical protein [Paenibacillus sabuli]MBD2846074.1 hypothetical protein [Paenibacillus sabuli]
MRRRGSTLLGSLMLVLVAGCAEETRTDTIFQAAGESWEATVYGAVVAEDKLDYFSIEYTYLGEPDDLERFDRIVFAQGTSLGTQVVNLYDPTYKKRRIEEGRYDVANEDENGILVEDIRNKELPTFVIDYRLQESGEMNTLDYIEMGDVSLQLVWEAEGERYEDTIRGQ